jgi:hypothetical protein
MKRQSPIIFTPLNILQQCTIKYASEDGHVANAFVRPRAPYQLTFRKRLNAAWMVFTGKWDVINWER